MDSPSAPGQPGTSGNGAATRRLPAHNLAARMARWSSRHRKKAFWGWLVFVVLAFAIGTFIGFAIDSSRVGSTVVFSNRNQVRVSPIVAPGAIGVQARLSLR